MWRWLSVLSFDHPHLSPAMFQPFVLPLLLGEVPSPFTCWNTSKNKLEFWGEDSPSRALSVVRRTVGLRRLRLGSRLRRFPAKLAACAVKVSSWSRPGQSRPRSTGTGRSFTIPTSKCQVPGFAVMATRRVGTWCVSPCMHLMGILALESASGANTAGETKLIALPVSNSAWKERPLTLTRAWRASCGGSRCTAQPASQVRGGERVGSVGMGSSWLPGTAGLLTVHWGPSGERRSWYTLRGNGGALSPASCRRVASASSTPSTASPTVRGFLIPAACRRGRGSALRNRSTTTRSATWEALGFPARSQCSAAWARAGTLPSYCHDEVHHGIEKYACWGSPVNKGARIRAQSSCGHLSLSATTSNILRKFSASSWPVIFGNSWAACTRGSDGGTRGAVAVRRAATSLSVSPWRAAMCSTICCCRMLTSVRCFNSSSMAGEELPPESINKNEKTQGKKKKEKICSWCTWGGPVILQSHARILHQCGGLKNHTTVLSEVNSPEGEFIEQTNCKSDVSAGGVQCCLPLWCWCPFFLPWWVVLGDSVLAAGGAVSQSCLGRTEKHTLTALLAGGIAHPSLSSRGFCSTPQSRFSWVRSARRDEEQVFLLRCQGDADWFPGQVSQYEEFICKNR